ncbi:MAG: triose-phosphate isomerase [Nanoarchaeota archaeon]
MYKLVINMKTYEEATDKKAIKIAKACQKLSKQAKKRNVEIILCPQPTDLKEIAKTKITTFSQHFDPLEAGAHTGYILPHALTTAGAKGSLISHSEHILPIPEIEKRILTANAHNLKTIVCARDEYIAERISMLKIKPDYIAVEPKELIGGDISISTAKPSLITRSLAACGNIPLLVGAGVKTTKDVQKSIELGAKGILVASGVDKAKDVVKAIKELLEGFPKK